MATIPALPAHLLAAAHGLPAPACEGWLSTEVDEDWKHVYRPVCMCGWAHEDTFGPDGADDALAEHLNAEPELVAAP